MTGKFADEFVDCCYTYRICGATKHLRLLRSCPLGLRPQHRKSLTSILSQQESESGAAATTLIDAGMKTLRRFSYLLLTITLVIGSQRNANASDEESSLSPDKQWRYVLVDGHWPEIQKTDTARRALDLMPGERSAPHTEWNEVVWAPDSKRFAFNFGPPTVPHSTYVTTAFYQLRGEEWVPLDSPINEDSSKDTFAG